MGPPFGGRALLTFTARSVRPISTAVGSPCGPHRTRSPPGPCSRDESVLHRDLAVPAVATFLGFAPPEPALLRPGTGFRRGYLPSRPPVGQRFIPPGPQGLSARRSRTTRFRAANSHGVLGLLVIVALRSSPVPAGSSARAHEVRPRRDPKPARLHAQRQQPATQ